MVRLGVHGRTGQRVAVKVVSKQLFARDQLRVVNIHHELELLQSLDHPSIVRVLDALDTPAYFFIVMELVEGVELFDYIQQQQRHHSDVTSATTPTTPTTPTTTTTNDSQRIRFIFRQLVDAVRYLHSSKHISHRDLKLENIIVDPLTQRIKVIDFGLATRYQPGKRLTARCGSEEYTCPEVIKAEPYEGPVPDVWSLGIILFALLTGQLPFNNVNPRRPKEIFHRICKGDFTFPRKPQASPAGKDLVKKILQPVLERRFTLDQIADHEFVREEPGNVCCSPTSKQQ